MPSGMLVAMSAMRAADGEKLRQVKRRSRDAGLGSVARVGDRKKLHNAR
jgi:hypothetical protein